MMREAVIVSLRQSYPNGVVCGLRVRGQRRAWWGGVVWGPWLVVGEPGAVEWPETEARRILDDAVELGWVESSRFSGFCDVVRAREES